MTVRTVTNDERVLHINPYAPAGNFLVGRYYTKTQNGINRQPGEPEWYPHGYSMTLTDTFTGWARETKRVAPECSYGGQSVDEPVDVSSALIRPWTANDDLALYGKFGEQYDFGSFDTPVFAGELGETTDMLANRFRQLCSVGAAVKKGNLMKAAKLLGVSPPSKRAQRFHKRAISSLQSDQTVTAAWLELQYGWKPLIRDISDLADSIAKRDTPRKRRLFAKHWIGRRFSAVPSCAIATGTGKYSKSITAYVEEIPPTLLSRMGLHDPSAVLWELTPFSFVADWAYPVGDYLKARSLATRAKGVFVLTTYDVFHGSVRSINCPLAWCGVDRTLQSIAWKRKVTLSRSVSTTLPVPPLPEFRNPFGGNGPMDRLMSAVSLVREVFGDKLFRRT